MTEDEKAAYLRVAAAIRREIESGERPEGSKLPTLDELRATFKVGRGVAERAIGQLRAEGLVSVRQGSGAIVQRYQRIDRVSPDRLREDWRAHHAIQDHDTGDRWRGVTTEVGETPAPDWVAALLKVEPGAAVTYRTRQFLVDERAVQLSTSYLPVELARGTPIMHTDPGEGGIYGRLADRGFKPTRFDESIIARAATSVERTQLDLPRRSSMVFEITRGAYAVDRCVEVNRMVLDVESYRLVYRFPA